MSVLIKGMKMPKDCPMCPMAHYDTLNHFRGCEVVAGKRHAINDPEYANTSTRPDWCPLIELPPHGRLIDADALDYSMTDYAGNHLVYMVDIQEAPTIIPADNHETCYQEPV